MNIWKSSKEKLHSTKWLALMAFFLALRIICSRFSVPVGVNLNVSLSFVLVALSGALFGPVAGSVFAFAEDILEFMLFPSPYGFFAGYTLSAVLGILCYAFFFYEKKITILNILLAKLLSSYAVNVCIGSFWNWIITGKSKAYLYYATKSYIKNTTLFPIQVVLLVLVFNLLIPFLSRKQLIKTQSVPVSWK